MGKQKSPVIVVERSLVSSAAYLALRGVAPQLLLLFLGRRRLTKIGKKGRWVCVNAQELEFTYLEAQRKFGITNARFTRAIDELIAKGFIEIVHHGGCYQKDKTRYGLSERWRRYRLPEFLLVKRPKDLVRRGYRRPNGLKSKEGRTSYRPISTAETGVFAALEDGVVDQKELLVNSCNRCQPIADGILSHQIISEG